MTELSLAVAATLEHTQKVAEDTVSRARSQRVAHARDEMMCGTVHLDPGCMGMGPQGSAWRRLDSSAPLLYNGERKAEVL